MRTYICAFKTSTFLLTCNTMMQDILLSHMYKRFNCKLRMLHASPGQTDQDEDEWCLDSDVVTLVQETTPEVCQVCFKKSKIAGKTTETPPTTTNHHHSAQAVVQSYSSSSTTYCYRYCCLTATATDFAPATAPAAATQVKPAQGGRLPFRSWDKLGRTWPEEHGRGRGAKNGWPGKLELSWLRL